MFILEQAATEAIPRVASLFAMAKGHFARLDLTEGACATIYGELPASLEHDSLHKRVGLRLELPLLGITIGAPSQATASNVAASTNAGTALADATTPPPVRLRLDGEVSFRYVEADDATAPIVGVGAARPVSLPSTAESEPADSGASLRAELAEVKERLCSSQIEVRQLRETRPVRLLKRGSSILSGLLSRSRTSGRSVARAEPVEHRTEGSSSPWERFEQRPVNSIPLDQAEQQPLQPTVSGRI